MVNYSRKEMFLNMKKTLCAILCAMLCLCTLTSALGETLVMSLIGDCTVGDQYCYRGYKSSYTYKIGQSGLDYPFSLAADLFKNDDLTVANCEGVFTKRSPGKDAKFMTLGADPSFAEVFKLGYVDVVNTANNHGRDFGNKGREDTLKTFADLDIGAFGDDTFYTTTVKGVKFGFFGYSYPFNDAKIKKYKKNIKTLRDEGCTFIVASCHWGKEDSLKINLEQKKYAEKIIDLGADMVYGHGSHTVQPLEYYKGKMIFYSLSNFTFGANAAPKDDDTVVVQVTFDVHEDGTMTATELRAIPYKMHMNKDFRPYPIEDEAGKQQVWKKLIFTRSSDPDSNMPESFLTTGYADLRLIDGEGK